MEELQFRYSVVGRAEDGRVIIVLLDGDPPERCGLFRCDAEAAKRLAMGLVEALLEFRGP